MRERHDGMTALVVELFRLNGELLSAGDELVAGLGLTSARWQVLGAIDLSPIPLPVAQTARNMGLSRQAVQRIANELAAEGLVAFSPNPQHQRAKLLAMTPKGRRAFDAAMALQRPWIEALGSDISDAQIAAAHGVARALRQRLADNAVRKRAGRGMSNAHQEQF